MNKFKKGDQVIVRTGQDKGRRGIIERIIMGTDGKPALVVVQGINLKTNYERPNPDKNEPGGLVKRESPLHISNVSLIDPDSGRAARVRIGQTEGGKNARIFASGKAVSS